MTEAWLLPTVRALFNVVLLIGLISIVALTWDKPLRERISEMPVVGPYLSSSSTEVLQPARVTRVGAHTQPERSPQTNGAWMWDPNHRTALDRPAYNQTHGFTNHVYYVDNNGAKYWVDAQGQRDYEP